MLKLLGFPLSNYYNMVKMALLEKGIEFEEVLVKVSQEDDFLAMSPMGKVPCLQTEQGYLTETSVIIDYLEDLNIGPSLYPADPYEKAKTKELIKYIELYVELSARQLFGEVFFGKPATDLMKETAKAQLEKGFSAVARIAKYGPYIAGSEFTYADIVFHYSMGLATLVTKKAFDWDTFNTESGLKDLLDLVGSRDSAKRIKADQDAARAA